MNVNAKFYSLTGAGTEIANFNVTDTYDLYVIQGVATATGNYTISLVGSPQAGTFFKIKYRGTLNLGGTYTFSILGQSFTQNQLLSKLDIECYHNGSGWVIEILPSFADAVVEAANIVAGAVTTTKLGANSVTNAKLAQMADQTIKGNISGGVADPADIPIGSMPYWNTTGNSGTNPSTNFIGTTDNAELVFRVFNQKSGLIGVPSTRNVALGLIALDAITTGTENTALGAAAATNIISGEHNTCIGAYAGNVVIAGGYNTFVGHGANPDIGGSNAQNRIALGYGAEADADFQFAIPNNVTTIKWQGIVYTLPTTLPASSGVLTCDSSGNLAWI